MPLRVPRLGQGLLGRHALHRVAEFLFSWRQTLNSALKTILDDDRAAFLKHFVENGVDLEVFLQESKVSVLEGKYGTLG